MQRIPTRILVPKWRAPYWSVAYYTKSQLGKIKRSNNDRNTNEWTNNDQQRTLIKTTSYSPSTRPLVERVRCHLRHPDTTQAIFILPPGVTFLLFGADPVPRLRVLGVWNMGRKNRDNWLGRNVRHVEWCKLIDGGDVDRDVGRVKSRAQVG